MRNFRALVVVSALAAVALLAPSTAQAAPADKSTSTAIQYIYSWRP